MWSLRRSAVPLLAGVCCAALLLNAVSRQEPSSAPGASARDHRVAARAGTDISVPAAARRPDIVLVLLDDLSLELLQTMRQAQRMRAAGASYPHAFVVDSLCCASRASIFTGQYPHQTGVLTNTANLPNAHGPVGGWKAFESHGNARRSFNVRLKDSGYATGFVGKYLNEYETESARPVGWSEWRPVFEGAYDGWGFGIRRRDGALRYVEPPPASASPATKDRAYATNLIGRVGRDFIQRHRRAERPYFLEVAMFAPHSRLGGHGAYPGDRLYPPAFADRPSDRRPPGNCGAVSCPSLGLRDLRGFGDARGDNRPYDARGRLAPSWRTNPVRLSVHGAVRDLRDRARMVQSADRWLARLAHAAGPDAYVILTSDNGFHLGQHSLERGKGAPYDSDVHVPLLVTGPGVAPGPRRDLVANIDLAPTLESLAGIGSPDYRFGTSFADSLRDATDADRDHVFFEHTWALSRGEDPDKVHAGGTMDLIPSYVAVRDRRGLLVRFDLDNRWSRTRFAWEFYDYRDDRFERTNTYELPAEQPAVAELRRALRAFLACSHTRRGAAVPDGCRNL